VAEEKSKPKRPLFGEKAKKRLDVSVQAVIDNMVFSKREVWAYYRLSSQMFDFLSEAVQISNGARVTTAFTALVENRRDPLDLHFITTSTPIDVESWHAQVASIVSDWEGNTPAFNGFLEDMADHLRVEEYTNRIAYMGIKLGNRGALNFSAMNPLESGMKAAWESFKSWINTATKTFDGDVSATEEKEFRQKAERYSTIIRNGALQGAPISSEEILLLIKRMLYPTMPAPYLDVDHNNRWGAGDLELETASVIRSKFRWLEITQLLGGREITGYRAALSISKFARTAQYPRTALPFLYIPQMLLELPFTTYSRVKLLPNGKMRKEIEKRRKEQADQLINMQGAARKSAEAAVEDNSRVRSDLEDLRELDETTATDKTPWVEGSYRLVLEATSEQAMRELVAAIKQTYSENNITTVLSSGDQLDLFLEQMPGDRIRVNSFRQLTNLNHLSTSGFNFSSDVGDKIWDQSTMESDR